MFNVEALQVELTKAAAWAMAFEALGFLVGMLVLYFVLKSAIRDGIDESRMGRDTRISTRDHKADTAGAPPMHADR